MSEFYIVHFPGYCLIHSPGYRLGVYGINIIVSGVNGDPKPPAPTDVRNFLTHSKF